MSSVVPVATHPNARTNSLFVKMFLAISTILTPILKKNRKKKKSAAIGQQLTCSAVLLDRRDHPMRTADVSHDRQTSASRDCIGSCGRCTKCKGTISRTELWRELPQSFFNPLFFFYSDGIWQTSLLLTHDRSLGLQQPKADREPPRKAHKSFSGKRQSNLSMRFPRDLGVMFLLW